MPGSVSVNDADLIEVVSVRYNSTLASQIDDLLRATSLGENVVHSRREGMFGGQDVSEYRPGPLPVVAWSTGEKALWLFLASITGIQPVNLYGLAMQFRGTPEGNHIQRLVRTLFYEGN